MEVKIRCSNCGKLMPFYNKEFLTDEKERAFCDEVCLSEFQEKKLSTMFEKIEV